MAVRAEMIHSGHTGGDRGEGGRPARNRAGGLRHFSPAGAPSPPRVTLSDTPKYGFGHTASGVTKARCPGYSDLSPLAGGSARPHLLPKPALPDGKTGPSPLRPPALKTIEHTADNDQASPRQRVGNSPSPKPTPRESRARASMC